MFSLTVEEIVVRLAAASICGMLIGLEREAKNRPAGLRTFMMVSLGACGFTLIVLHIVDLYGATDNALQIDPVRIVEGVVGGIGFLGAGAIIQSQGQIKGVTTGAGIWVAGAIGVACGFGMYILSLLLTLAALFILLVVGALETKWMKK